MLASRPARCPGWTPRVMVATAPRKAAPKPNPVTTAATNRTATDPVHSDATVPATPPAKIRAPTTRARPGAAPRIASEPRTPVPFSAKIRSPPARWLLTPNTSTSNDGPREAYRPPSAQVATRTGRATTNGRRCAGGTCTCGRSEASAPGSRGDVSGSRNTVPTDARTNTAVRTAKTQSVGDGTNCTSSPAPT